MLYIVHVFNTQSKKRFREHRPAFQAFKTAAKQNLTVALWHQDSRGGWKIVHSSGFYPTAMTQPPSMLYDSNKGVA